MMTGGMATIAGGVLAAYVSFGISAGHLLTASVMSAPAALLIAKVMLPETEQSETAAGASARVPRETTNGLDALCRGAVRGNDARDQYHGHANRVCGGGGTGEYLISLGLRQADVTTTTPLQTLFGWLNAPFAWLMGVPWKDCRSRRQRAG